MASVNKERSWDGVGRIHRLRMPRYNNLPERAKSLVSFRHSVPHVPEVQLSEGIDFQLPQRYDRTHLEVTETLVTSVGVERPLPIREIVIVSLQQPAWREFFGRILHQNGPNAEAPLQNPA